MGKVIIWLSHNNVWPAPILFLTRAHSFAFSFTRLIIGRSCTTTITLFCKTETIWWHRRRKYRRWVYLIIFGYFSSSTFSTTIIWCHHYHHCCLVSSSSFLTSIILIITIYPHNFPSELPQRVFVPKQSRIFHSIPRNQLRHLHTIFPVLFHAIDPFSRLSPRHLSHTMSYLDRGRWLQGRYWEELLCPECDVGWSRGEFDVYVEQLWVQWEHLFDHCFRQWRYISQHHLLLLSLPLTPSHHCTWLPKTPSIITSTTTMRTPIWSLLQTVEVGGSDE